MNYGNLRQEIISDPLGRGYVGMTDGQVAADLNTSYRSRKLRLKPAALLSWAGASSRYAKIQDATANSSNAIRSSAYSLLRFLEIGELDLADAAHDSLIDGLVTGTILTPADRAALVSEATKSLSRADELDLPVVKPYHVAKARE